MPNPTNRESLNKGLESRYATQRAGGAFDAKTAGKVPVDFLNNNFADGFTIRTTGNQDTHLAKKDSSYLKGFNNIKYKG